MRQARRGWIWLTVVSLLVCSMAGVPGPGGARAGSVLQWTPWNSGLEGSPVTCLAPDEGTGSFIAGTASEGIYRTADAGATWNWIGDGLPVTSAATALHAVQYAKVNTLLVRSDGKPVLAGTAAGLFALAANRWAQVAGFPHVSVRALAESSTGVIYAGTDAGVVRSRDGGTTWLSSPELLARDTVYCFLFDPRYPQAVMCGASGGVYRSADAGASWQLMNAGVQPTVLIQHPRRPDTLFAGSFAGVLRSFDYGTSWTQLTPASVQGGIVGLSESAVDPSILVAACPRGTVVSHDEGQTWQWVLGPNPDLGLTTAPFLSPDGETPVLAGARTGAVLLQGASIRGRSVGLGFLTTTALAADVSVDRFYAARSVGLFQGGSAGSWTLTTRALVGVDVVGLAVDPLQPAAMVAADSGSLYESADHGQTWSQTVTHTPGTVSGVACDSSVSGTVYVATSRGLFRLADVMNAMWEDVGPVHGSPCSAVAVSRPPETLLTAVFGSSVYRSPDRGQSWSVSGTAPSGALLALAVDPADTSRVYAGTDAGAFVSQDQGATWNSWGWGLSGIPVRAIAFPFRGSSSPMVATEKGVYRLSSVTDDRPPVLAVDSPLSGTTVNEASVEVMGSVIDHESGVVLVTVAGRTVTPDAEGRYTAQVSLQSGSNHIEVAAVDAAGNRTSVTLTVSFVRPSKTLQLTIGSTVMRVVGGNSVTLDAAPQILRGRTFLPIRAVAETLGGTVLWNASTQAVTVTLGTASVVLRIGSPTAQVNGVSRPIDASDSQVVPVIAGGRTLLPLRFVGEALGCLVEWDAAARMVTVTYPAP